MTIANLVRETISTTGQVTSNLQLAGKVDDGHKRFIDAFPTGASGIPVLVTTNTKDRAVALATYDHINDQIDIVTEESIIVGVPGSLDLTLAGDTQVMVIADTSFLGAKADKLDTYTKSEVDAKDAAIALGIDWKESVATFADIATTHPLPVEGWMVHVNDTDKVYRYNGSAWEVWSEGAIPLATPSVDGKMPAGDKGKLDGIEAGATGDQTANEILTALKTVDGVGSGLDADLFDGKEVAAFMEKSGGAFTGEVNGPNFVLDAIVKLVKSSANFVGIELWDTSAWRDKVRHTSYYKEALNTATRGATRKPPKLILVLAETDTITLYDATDPDVPMWKEFNNTSANSAIIRSATPAGIAVSSIDVFDGLLAVGENGANGAGCYQLDFIKDTAEHITANPDTARYNGNLATANDGDGWTVVSSIGIVNANVNAVAITAQPGAAIDIATGLPLPAIAVATDGNPSISLLQKDGGIYTGTGIGSTTSVAFSGTNMFASRGNAASRLYYRRNVDGISAAFDFSANYGDDTIPAILPYAPGGATGGVCAIENGPVLLGLSNGLVAVYEDEETTINGMVAITCKDYATGLMHGDNRGCLLADTVAETVGGELVTDGTNPATTAAWTASSDSTLAIDTSRLKVATNPGTTLGIGTQAIPTVVGKKYYLSVGYEQGTSTNVRFLIGTTAIGGEILDSGNISTAASTYTVFFTATATTTYIGLGVAEDGTHAFFNNISSAEAADDRSVNSNHAAITGSLTKSEVAAGADLMWWSGWAPTAYAEIPYTADHDFGTGDFCVIGHLKENANSTLEYIFERSDAARTVRYAMRITGAGVLEVVIDDGTASLDTVGTKVVDDSEPRFCALVRRGTELELWVDDAVESITIANATGSLSVTDGALSFGANTAHTEPLTNGSLALWRISASAPTAAQISRMYHFERKWFTPGAQITLGGTSDAVQIIKYNIEADEVYVGTADGVTVFSLSTGLVIEYIDAVSSDLTTDNIIAIAVKGGWRAIASDAEAILITDTENMREAFL